MPPYTVTLEEKVHISLYIDPALSKDNLHAPDNVFMVVVAEEDVMLQVAKPFH